MKPDLAQDVIELLERYIQKIGSTQLVNVLEHGAGASTVWFAERADLLVSFESDPKWFTTVGGWLAERNLYKHVKLFYWPEPPYKLPAELPRKYDIILVDGRHRLEFAKEAIKRMHEDSILIFDDMEREKYKEFFGIANAAGLMLHLYEKNLKYQEYKGERISDPYTTYTAVFTWLD